MTDVHEKILLRLCLCFKQHKRLPPLNKTDNDKITAADKEINVKINFTKEQYEALLKTVYIGAGIVHSVEEEGPDENEFDALEQYLLSFAKEFGVEHYADFDEEEKRYRPSEELEEDESVVEYLHRYDDYTFWDKLVYNLAERDMIKKHGKSIVAKMSEEECLAKGQTFVQRYQKEFEKNGIKNLTIAKS